MACVRVLLSLVVISAAPPCAVQAAAPAARAQASVGVFERDATHPGLTVDSVVHTRAATQEPAVVVCRPDAPAVKLGAKVTLRAFTSARVAPASEGKFRWEVSGGALEGRGATVTWQLPSTQPAPYTATVLVEGTGVASTCTLQVFTLGEGQLRGPTETRRRVSTGNQEHAGFHRYSYFLFGSKPSDELMRQRYLAALEAYVAILPVPEVLIPAAQLNVTILPVTAQPTGAAESRAEWLLEHYDWERARLLLGKLTGDHLSGPYIVSSRQPLQQSVSSRRTISIRTSHLYRRHS